MSNLSHQHHFVEQVNVDETVSPLLVRLVGLPLLLVGMMLLGVWCIAVWSPPRHNEPLIEAIVFMMVLSFGGVALTYLGGFLVFKAQLPPGSARAIARWLAIGGVLGVLTSVVRTGHLDTGFLVQGLGISAVFWRYGTSGDRKVAPRAEPPQESPPS